MSLSYDNRQQLMISKLKKYFYTAGCVKWHRFFISIWKFYIYLSDERNISTHSFSLTISNKQLAVSSERWLIIRHAKRLHTQTIHPLIIIIIDKTMIMHVFAHHRNQNDFCLWKWDAQCSHLTNRCVLCAGVLHMQIISLIICCYPIVALVCNKISYIRWSAFGVNC